VVGKPYLTGLGKGCPSYGLYWSRSVENFQPPGYPRAYSAESDFPGCAEKLLLLSRHAESVHWLSPMLTYSDSESAESKHAPSGGGVECFRGEPCGWLAFV
jgi:hypothetical protein